MTTETSTTHQPIFPEIQAATNMPFFDGSTLVLCKSELVTEKIEQTEGFIWVAVNRNAEVAEKFKDLPKTQRTKYRAWKLGYCNLEDKIIHTIHTGLPDDVTERSPSFYWDGKQLHLSFVAGTLSLAGPSYKLYTCFGKDFEHLSIPIAISKAPLIFGFVSPIHICQGIGNSIYLTEKISKKRIKLRTTFHLVLSTTFLSDDPAKLLITGKDEKHHYQTIIYDLSSNNVTNISDGRPTYKSSLHKNTLIHARKIEQGYENRQLFIGSYQSSQSSIQIFEEY